jgi:hypothetical protein
LFGFQREFADGEKAQVVAARKFALKQRYDRIDFEEDHLYPEIEAFKAGKPVLGLDAGMAFDLVIDDADSDSSSTPDAK